MTGFISKPLTEEDMRVPILPSTQIEHDIANFVRTRTLSFPESVPRNQYITSLDQITKDRAESRREKEILERCRALLIIEYDNLSKVGKIIAISLTTSLLTESTSAA